MSKGRGERGQKAKFLKQNQNASLKEQKKFEHAYSDYAKKFDQKFGECMAQGMRGKDALREAMFHCYRRYAKSGTAERLIKGVKRAAARPVLNVLGFKYIDSQEPSRIIEMMQTQVKLDRKCNPSEHGHFAAVNKLLEEKLHAFEMNPPKEEQSRISQHLVEHFLYSYASLLKTDLDQVSTMNEVQAHEADAARNAMRMCISELISDNVFSARERSFIAKIIEQAKDNKSITPEDMLKQFSNEKFAPFKERFGKAFDQLKEVLEIRQQRLAQVAKDVAKVPDDTRLQANLLQAAKKAVLGFNAEDYMPKNAAAARAGKRM